VRAYLRHLPPYGHGTLYNHMQLQPVLHIDSAAGTAKGRWRTLMMVGRLGTKGRWGEATYENAYVREAAGGASLSSTAWSISTPSTTKAGTAAASSCCARSRASPRPAPEHRLRGLPEPVIAPFHYDEV
jgi:hypothetical protein